MYDLNCSYLIHKNIGSMASSFRMMYIVDLERKLKKKKKLTTEDVTQMRLYC